MAENEQAQAKPMTPVQALQVLDQSTAKYQGSRQDHIMIQQALQTLHGALNDAGVLQEVEEDIETTPDNITELNPVDG